MRRKTLLSILMAAFVYIGGYAQNFIMELTYTGSTDEIIFSFGSTGPVNYTWSASPSGNSGSGTIPANTSIANLPVNVGAGEIVTLSIEPDNLSKLGLARVGRYVTDVLQWGSAHWTTMAGFFVNCRNLVEFSATDVPDLSGVKDMSGMFTSCRNFNGDLSAWDVSNVTDMEAMFSTAINFNGDISSWDVSNVTNMNRMFRLARSFNQDIGSWDVSSVVEMNNMLSGMSAFDQDLGDWVFHQDVVLTSLPGMGCANYSATLIGWQANNPGLMNKTLNAGRSQYGTNAEAARKALIDNQGWTITYDSPSGTVCGTATSRMTTENNLVNGQINTTSIYPSVTNSSVIINAVTDQTILVTGMDGRQVDQIKVKKGTTNFDMSPLKTGLYFFRSNLGEVTKVIKK